MTSALLEKTHTFITENGGYELVAACFCVFALLVWLICFKKPREGLRSLTEGKAVAEAETPVDSEPEPPERIPDLLRRPIISPPE
ncbi:unnamed protein product, partial [marine sediment metagenome]